MIENSSLLYNEKSLENEYSMINDDYDMLKEIYIDDIKEIIFCFILIINVKNK